MNDRRTPATGHAPHLAILASLRIHWPLGLILTAFAGLALAYNLAVPIGEASDEPTHLEYVYHLLERRRLPVLSEPGGEGITQAKHPPLYYLAAALLAAPARPTRVILPPNPHFTFNLDRPLAPNAFIHRDQPFPYRGSPGILAARVMRLVSLLGGLVLVWATYQIARTVWPGDSERWWASAAVVAFLPGFVFSASTVNNDSLGGGLAALVLLGALRLVDGHVSRRDLLRLGSVLGLAMMAKVTTISVIGVVGLAALLRAYRQRDWSALPPTVGYLGLPLVVLTGWWFARNMRLYGADDPTAWKIFQVANPQLARDIPLSSEFGLFLRLQFMSFWGAFGWMTIRWPPSAYSALAVLTATAAVGLVVVAWRWRRLAGGSRWGLALVAAVAGLSYLSVLRLALVLDMVMAHGRYLYIGLAALGVLFVTGLTEPFPRRARRWVALGLSAGMLALSVASLFWLIIPTFRLPTPVAAGELAAMGHRTGIDFGDRLRLLGYDLVPERATAGQALTVTLYWQALPGNTDPLPERDAALIGYVHVVDAGANVVVRLDRSPFGGRHPTVAWNPGEVLRQTYYLSVGPGAVPGKGAILIGWYPEGRPQAVLRVSRAGTRLAAGWRIAPFVIRPSQPVVFDPALAVERSDRLGGAEVARLRGYRLAGAIAAGRTVTVTLYWQPETGPFLRDLTVFVHLAGPDGRPLATGDGPPQAGRYPTSLWEAGEIIADPHVVHLPVDLPPGEHRLRVGLYDFTGVREMAFRADGSRWPDDAVELELPD